MRNGLKYTLVLVFPLTLLWGQVKIGEDIDILNPAAILELESTRQGLLLPRMTTSQRDSIPIQENTEGLLIFNVDSNAIQYLKREPASAANNKKRPSYLWESAQDDRIRFTQTSHPEEGQLFFDALETVLYLWNGSAWIAHWWCAQSHRHPNACPTAQLVRVTVKHKRGEYRRLTAFYSGQPAVGWPCWTSRSSRVKRTSGSHWSTGPARSTRACRRRNVWD